MSDKHQTTRLNGAQKADFETQGTREGLPPTVQTNGHYQLSPDDVVIGVMGLTGSGKSTLISTLTNEDIPVGHNLQSCTSKVDIYATQYRGSNIFFVDTPGFDDTFRSDTQVLKDVAYFLTTLYVNKIKLAGMIYLHRITDPKMGGSALKNLHMFEKLCGKDSLQHIVLATTMWDALGQTPQDREIGEGREKELLSNERFWGYMAKRGSTIMRHDGSAKSAWRMVEHLCSKRRSVILDIQRQMVDENQSLDNTSAGQELRKELIKAQEKYEKELAELRESMEEALKSRDEAAAAELRRLQEEADAQIERAEQDRIDMQLDLEDLIEEQRRSAEARVKEMDADRRRLEAELESRSGEVSRLSSRLDGLHAEMSDRTAREERHEREAQYAREHEQMMASINGEQQRQREEAEQRRLDAEAASARNKGLAMTLMQLISGTALTGLGLAFKQPAIATTGIGMAGRAILPGR